MRVEEPGWALARHSSSQATRLLLALASGAFIVAEFRVTPAGKRFIQMMSEGIVRTFGFPEPIRHSPKAIVLLVPSRTSAKSTTPP